eukprot:gene11997-25129_t
MDPEEILAREIDTYSFENPRSVARSLYGVTESFKYSKLNLNLSHSAFGRKSSEKSCLGLGVLLGRGAEADAGAK